MLETPESNGEKAQQNGGPLLFDAVLRPHRSLSPTGFLILMIAIVAASFLAGIAFWRMGAWPIPGFLGLDVLLIYGAFKLNYRAGRLFETVQLSQSELVVRRVTPGGKKTKWIFQPFWVRVELSPMGEEGNRLTLSSHGRQVTLGRFLTPEEREDFAGALQSALQRQKATHPA